MESHSNRPRPNAGHVAGGMFDMQGDAAKLSRSTYAVARRSDIDVHDNGGKGSKTPVTATRNSPATARPVQYGATPTASERDRRAASRFRRAR